MQSVFAKRHAADDGKGSPQVFMLQGSGIRMCWLYMRSLAAEALTFFLVAVVFLGLGAAAFLGLGAAVFLAGVFFLAGACSMPAHQQAVMCWRSSIECIER